MRGAQGLGLGQLHLMPIEVFDHGPQSPRRNGGFADNFGARFNQARESQPDIGDLETQPQFTSRLGFGTHGINLENIAAVFAGEMLRAGTMTVPDKG